MKWRRFGESALLLVGVSALAYWGIVSAFSTSLNQASPRHAVVAPRVEGDLVGRIEVPRLELSSVVLEGVSDATLRVGSGHIPGTPLPGQGGNAGIAAHRDGAFHKLEGIQAGDRVMVTTARGQVAYRVAFTAIAEPNDTRLLGPTDADALTLVTCYPFWYVGAAPQRFVVRALRDPGLH